MTLRIADGAGAGPTVGAAQTVILVRGQSLSYGHNGTVAGLPTEWAHLADDYPAVKYAYDVEWPVNGVGDPVYTRTWGDLGPHASTSGDLGPALSLGRRLPSNHRILLSGHGGTNLNAQWAHDSVASMALWTRSNARAAERIATAQPSDSEEAGRVLVRANAFTTDSISSVPGSMSVGGMVWIQGTSDGLGSEALSLDYGANLAEHIAEFRTAYGAGLPFVFNRLHTDNTATYAANIRSGQDWVAANVSNVAMVNTDDAPLVDSFHHGSLGYAVMGDRLGVALAGLA